MYKNEETVVFLNGKWVKASEAKTSLYNQTLHYGTGVFEGIRSYATEDGVRVFKSEEHYERLHFSAKKMHMALPYTVDELTKFTYQLLEKNNLKDAYIRPLVYTDESMSLQVHDKVNVVIMAWDWGKYLGNDHLRVMVSPYKRLNKDAFHVEAKVCGHYVNSSLATTHAKQQGFDEALLLDENNYVAEGPGANFFFEKNGELFTPSTGNILNGITRQTIIEIARNLDIKVHEGNYTLEDVEGADGAFYTGTAAEVVLIKSIDDNEFKLAPEDTLGHELSRAYKQRVSKNEYQHFSLV